MTDSIGETLTQADLDLLRRISRDEKTEVALETAARFERLNLIMRGWGKTHVVTAQGIKYLNNNH